MSEFSYKKSSSASMKQALEYGQKVLGEYVASPHNEALTLLQFSTGRTKENIIAHSEQALKDYTYRKYEQCLLRRKQGEPIAYIIEEKEFWSLALNLIPGVLIPRPETELVVEATLNLLPIDSKAQVMDLGTGSGCIALAIGKERPSVNILACDISTTCIETAKLNAVKLGVNNVSFAPSDWFKSIEKKEFDLIVSNPPYIAIDDTNLQDSVRKFEPKAALFSNHSGLENLFHIIMHARQFLRKQGNLILEHGWQQGTSVREQLTKNGYYNVRTLNDLQNHERVTVGTYNNFIVN